MPARILKENSQVVAINRQNSFYRLHGKRILDLLGALAGSIITSPILGFCAVAVRLDSPGPIFFRQWRIGEHGKPFRIVKLRTMVHNADPKGLKLTAAGDCRITRVGKWLRKTKLDEVPQLFNVLRGEMSFVGPRPEVPEYVASYSPEQKKILEFKPGITGPASLDFVDEEALLASNPDRESFYINTVLARKLELDMHYCNSINLFRDIKLIIYTIEKILTSRMAGEHKT